VRMRKSCPLRWVMRGKGCFERAVRGIKSSVAAGIPTRIHTVLTRWNLDKILVLAQFSKELRAPLSISPPNFLGQMNVEALKITNKEYKTFWREYLHLAEVSFPWPVRRRPSRNAWDGRWTIIIISKRARNFLIASPTSASTVIPMPLFRPRASCTTASTRGARDRTFMRWALRRPGNGF
jgi:molybdenum cofactor biosynthesis enzyme MoaA